MFSSVLNINFRTSPCSPQNIFFGGRSEGKNTYTHIRGSEEICQVVLLLECPVWSESLFVVPCNQTMVKVSRWILSVWWKHFTRTLPFSPKQCKCYPYTRYGMTIIFFLHLVPHMFIYIYILIRDDTWHVQLWSEFTSQLDVQCTCSPF